MSLLDRLRALALDDRGGVVDEGRAWPSRYLLFLATVLTERLAPRSVVASMLPSGGHFTAAQIGVIEAGAVFMPLPHKATAHELKLAFDLVTPDAILLAREPGDAVREALGGRDVTFLVAPPHQPDSAPDADVDRTATDAFRESEADLDWLQSAVGPRAPWLPAETAMLQLTSGSTGRPKGVLLSRGAIEAGVDASAAFAARFAGRAVFSPMPQFHAMGGAVVLEHLFGGSTVHVTNRFVPGDDRKRMQQAECAALVGSPSYFRMLLQLGMWKDDALPSLEAAILGSAPSDDALLAGLREASPAMSVHLRYGLSEAFGALTRLDVEAHDELPVRGLVGPVVGDVALGPLPPLDAAEAGEVRAKTLASALGVVREEGTVEALADDDGFVRTGDDGHLDEAGRLHLRGRRSQFIKRQGYRIDPGEIEQVLVAADGVREAVVVGVPDPLAGSKIVALVEGDAEPKALIKHCRAQLSAHKAPQKIQVVDAIPRRPSGKPDRAAVRRQVGGAG